MIALSAVEDEYGRDQEIAWRSPGVVGPIGRLDGSIGTSRIEVGGGFGGAAEAIRDRMHSVETGSQLSP